MVGQDATGALYAYFPMPFQTRALVQLVNNRSVPTPGVSYELKHQTTALDLTKTGTFKTRFTATTPASTGQDIPILDTTGTGKLVGVTGSYADPGGPGYLEGDERIYVDDAGSPAIYGTGTEDFFNGGYYFSGGPYSQPMSSSGVSTSFGGSYITGATRLLLQDAVPYSRHLKVSIQHGGHNETTGTNAWMLAYYYQQAPLHLTQTDTLNVGNTTSESAHAYTVKTQTFTGSRTYQYPGTADAVNVTDDGRAFKGSSQFNMAINSSNNGVVLRRRFDYGINNQLANVYVNGVLVGPWYNAGSDAYHRWRDSDFMIPASFTSGKSSITVKVQFVSSASDWNEFSYWAYSITP